MSKRDIEFIQAKLPKEELLTQLAEECAEFGKAALKYRRVLDGRNPTPVAHSEAYGNLLEEMADVLLCISVLKLDTVMNIYECGEICDKKLTRWVKRLRESDDTGNKGISKSAEEAGSAD